MIGEQVTVLEVELSCGACGYYGLVPGDQTPMMMAAHHLPTAHQAKVRFMSDPDTVVWLPIQISAAH